MKYCYEENLRLGVTMKKVWMCRRSRGKDKKKVLRVNFFKLLNIIEESIL